MVTKLRSFSTNSVTKAAAFILIIAVLTGLIVLSEFIYLKNIDPECIITENYLDSDSFLNLMRLTASGACGPIFSLEIPEDVPYYYYVSNGKSEWTNVDNPSKSYFEQFDSFCSLENGQWSFRGRDDFATAGEFSDTLSYYAVLKESNTIYIAYPEGYIISLQQNWQKGRAFAFPLAIAAAAGTALSLILAAYLAAVTGRKPQDRELHPGKMDAVYSDILAAAFIFLIFLWHKTMGNVGFHEPNAAGTINSKHIVSIFAAAAVTAFVSTICGLIALSLIRKLKAGRLIKHSLIYSLMRWIYNFGVSLFDGRVFSKYSLTKSLFYRQLAFIAASSVLVIFMLLFTSMKTIVILVPLVLEVILIYLYIKGNNKTYTDINKGFNESLEEQMKSERMKVALITNVSHDLKTPLTSIISYIDLLSKEDGLSDTAKDYVKILTEKSARLKNMVSDLFDLAKSTSGNMPVDIENLDLKKLIEQTLADMDDRIQKSGLSFRVKLPEKPIHIYADGKKLYRVFQNVIDNALKYSLQGTRVYISLDEAEGSAVAIIKNTAGYEMDFTVDEIMQRFSRGDKSRSTEGSGLGLSIAESFTRLCGGHFKVDIDGDLFKVTISFNFAEKLSAAPLLKLEEKAAEK